jgi:hypothetical protein
MRLPATSQKSSTPSLTLIARTWIRMPITAYDQRDEPDGLGRGGHSRGHVTSVRREPVPPLLLCRASVTRMYSIVVRPWARWGGGEAHSAWSARASPARTGRDALSRGSPLQCRHAFVERAERIDSRRHPPVPCQPAKV